MIKKLLLAFIVTVTFSHAMSQKDMKRVMDAKTKQVIQILQNKALTQNQKNKKSIKIMDPIFSYSTMAKISLGKKWKRLSKKEKASFTKAFEHKIKYSYIDKLKLYKKQKVLTSKPKKTKENRIKLLTKVIGDNETFKIVNSFYKKKNTNQWYIYDVKLAGVSIIQTYRKQFKAFLKTKSFAQLLKSL
jgi:phospholipid transport system substrate-binding protein